MQYVTDDSAVPGLRERKKRATRAALAEAAVRLAAEHGAENVTVEAISEAAGVSPRTFFNYFDSHDDAFVMIDRDAGERVRRAVREAPAGLSPLDAVREALATELVDVAERQEIWTLRAKVLQRSPQLLVRGLGAHMAEEVEMAETIAVRIGTRAPREKPPATDRSCETRPGTPGPDLYSRLLAAVAGTAARVAIEHWCAQGPGTDFAEVLRRVFAHLAAGLPEPPAAGLPEPPPAG
ncbi:TetR family transcriptional regulator [Streptomyces sp. GMY02]|uniref:TetR family transcriptional regulator n=1 Tax=Streptomyces sp. GMY02 TaxID=1333528 RepID=UPI001C2BD6F3|nr:TetR family transcriptional regulator [Streptomyces sp. GMY02]QXE38818.1 TetR family transcriptional regulator [Streptomyces sp. GMY02]